VKTAHGANIGSEMGLSVQLCKLLNSTKHRRWTDGTSTAEAEESPNA
jgi:hypothetical protein